MQTLQKDSGTNSNWGPCQQEEFKSCTQTQKRERLVMRKVTFGGFPNGYVSEYHSQVQVVTQGASLQTFEGISRTSHLLQEA